MSQTQLNLLEPSAALPEGFRYRPDFLSPAEEGELLRRLPAMPFREFEFHGYLGRRRVVSFGVRYDFADRALHGAAEMPDFLLPLRDRAAGFAEIAPAELAHALVTEYTPGAAIGWHRDRPQVGDVIGISLASPCRFRFRRKAGNDWRRAALILAPRSAYLLRGSVPREWEHSIPPAAELRYSITFRSLKLAPD